MSPTSSAVMPVQDMEIGIEDVADLVGGNAGKALRLGPCPGPQPADLAAGGGDRVLEALLLGFDLGRGNTVFGDVDQPPFADKGDADTDSRRYTQPFEGPLRACSLGHILPSFSAPLPGSV